MVSGVWSLHLVLPVNSDLVLPVCSDLVVPVVLPDICSDAMMWTFRFLKHRGQVSKPHCSRVVLSLAKP